MDQNLVEEMGLMAVEFVRKSMESGLTWDAAVASMGLASRMLAGMASVQGDGTAVDCDKLAAQRFSEGFSQQVVMIEGGSAQLEELRRRHPDADIKVTDLRGEPASPTKH